MARSTSLPTFSADMVDADTLYKNERHITGVVIYDGPSLIDGAPIVAIATAGSKNRKTGGMVQTWILRADVQPTLAVKCHMDGSICGTREFRCPHAGDEETGEGRSCYVTVVNAPNSVWKTYKRGRYPHVSPHLAGLFFGGRAIRLGAYGDPMAVPADVWVKLTVNAAKVTGYTHQWANPNLNGAAYRTLVMASCDSPGDYIRALSAGFRAFRVRHEGDPLLPREIVCPASDEGGHRTTCDRCGLCNGTRTAPKAANPCIIVHGTLAANFTRKAA